MLGLPGDWTSPSRFVRMAILKKIAKKTKTRKEAVNLAFHMLNTVSIHKGLILSKDKKYFAYTLWTVVKDLIKLQFFYRTYNNLNVSAIDLKKEIKQNSFGKKIISKIL